jgi:hypothetical protein
MNKRKLEERIEFLEKTRKPQGKKEGELTFNFQHLLGYDVELMTYEKECKTYYYLKRFPFPSIFSNTTEKTLTPEFESETELMIYLINNYEKIKNEKENE